MARFWLSDQWRLHDVEHRIRALSAPRRALFALLAIEHALAQHASDRLDSLFHDHFRKALIVLWGYVEQPRDQAELVHTAEGLEGLLSSDCLGDDPVLLHTASACLHATTSVLEPDEPDHALDAAYAAYKASISVELLAGGPVDSHRAYVIEQSSVRSKDMLSMHLAALEVLEDEPTSSHRTPILAGFQLALRALRALRARA